MPNVLEKICLDKAEELKLQKETFKLESFIDQLTPSDRSLYDALKARQPGFILECKKASPSKGLIREVFDLDEIVSAYKNYASGISVLTDKKYFQGDHEYLKYVRSQVKQPCLCKDFFIDPYQVYLARYYDADAILLMLSVLNDEQYKELAALAEQYQLDILTEVSNQVELDRAIALGAKIIGINNRNLRDLSTDLQTTRELAPKIPKDRIIISESGIYTHDHVSELSRYANAFLVGSSLMAQADLPAAVHKLVVGENKVCGLTRSQDAAAAKAAGAVYGGLIFAEKSPRFVTLQQAQAICQAVDLNYVGVFVNAPIATVVNNAKQLNLAAVQLHGQETPAYISELKSVLPDTCQIWKAFNPEQETPPQAPEVSRWLLDSGSKQQPGGTGHPLNWDTLDNAKIPQPFMLAGGINPENVAAAKQTGAIGLDINSGAESAPGIKDSDKLKRIFSQLGC
ncbi:bifunctional indole-3-glycerol-phosphate synthase TrpC/phosphoribosylanthranilate isomerase TrpF [Gayadomonas joobiniege]|uniref:bifunctional indole-3-glycerol-phosphate synthase TrpC/phosphoribosylanthranilate isomerase TrpF n=1 Tax=Gayadomonas joobiniege TaxID=1234606 RepID=UPI000377D260|nr:bifunctional indole-3-glycerol-phosphate synthase TrpC/phosphoribosylanthranilate isomerase TrpF [Gayadomonas joobiniege]